MDKVAEKTFKNLTAFSTRNPQIHCIAVVQAPPATTEAWAISCGGEWDVEVVSDPERRLYAQWGWLFLFGWWVDGDCRYGCVVIVANLCELRKEISASRQVRKLGDSGFMLGSSRYFEKRYFRR